MPRLHVLVDNRVHTPGLATEHGFSMLVELDDGSTWLWDVGATRVFLDNAKRMGLNLGRCSGLALSHGHWDHSGGAAALLAETGFAGPIYGHEQVQVPRYAIKDGKPERFIGLDTEALPWPPANFHGVRGSAELAPGLTYVTDVPRREGNFQACRGFFYDEAGQLPDFVPDDAFLTLEHPKGLIVILGCCHSGVANALTHARERSGGKSIHAVIGGMHLYDATPEALEQALSTFESLGAQRLAPGHCTGDEGIALLGERYPDKVEPLGSGLVLEF